VREDLNIRFEELAQMAERYRPVYDEVKRQLEKLDAELTALRGKADGKEGK